MSNEGHDDRHAWAATETEDLGNGLYRIPLPLPGDALHAVTSTRSQGQTAST